MRGVSCRPLFRKERLACFVVARVEGYGVEDDVGVAADIDIDI